MLKVIEKGLKLNIQTRTNQFDSWTPYRPYFKQAIPAIVRLNNYVSYLIRQVYPDFFVMKSKFLRNWDN
ncbi:MAG TPA: hypothetical protein DIW47_13340 [Bacteroidetes bacterium]|nr:hypothetical protein [Bacteroidota bacterium]